MSVTYSKRESILEKGLRSWTVTDDGLEVATASGHVSHIAWSAITGLQLSFAPTQYKPWRYRAVVKVRDGGKFEIDNGHYVHIGDFEDRSADYRDMIEALIDGLAAAKPNFRVHVGAGSMSYFSQMLFVGLMFAFLAYILWITDGGGAWAWPAVVKMGIVIASLPVLVAWAVLARPRTAPITAVPEQALPKV